MLYVSSKGGHHDVFTDEIIKKFIRAFRMKKSDFMILERMADKLIKLIINITFNRTIFVDGKFVNDPSPFLVYENKTTDFIVNSTKITVIPYIKNSIASHALIKKVMDKKYYELSKIYDLEQFKAYQVIPRKSFKRKICTKQFQMREDVEKCIPYNIDIAFTKTLRILNTIEPHMQAGLTQEKFLESLSYIVYDDFDAFTDIPLKQLQLPSYAQVNAEYLDILNKAPLVRYSKLQPTCVEYLARKNRDIDIYSAFLSIYKLYSQGCGDLTWGAFDYRRAIRGVPWEEQFLDEHITFPMDSYEEDICFISHQKLYGNIFVIEIQMGGNISYIPIADFVGHWDFNMEVPQLGLKKIGISWVYSICDAIRGLTRTKNIGDCRIRMYRCRHPNTIRDIIQDDKDLTQEDKEILYLLGGFPISTNKVLISSSAKNIINIKNTLNEGKMPVFVMDR